MRTESIDGPLGPFHIPAETPLMRQCAAGLARGVWGFPGAYDRPVECVPEYEHDALSLLEVGRVLDVGAGWGAFAVWAFWRWGSGIELHCYEPSAAACDFIRRNVADYAAGEFAIQSRTCVHQVAVSANPDVRLSLSEDWGSRATRPAGDCPDGEKVDVLHPAELPPCDILKCDAEGIEPELFSCYPHLSRVRAAIYEWHSQEHREQLRKTLEKTGFRCVRDDDGPWGPSNGVAVWIR